MASTPPSLVKFAARRPGAQHGLVELDPDQRPGARGDVGRPSRVGERDAHHGGGGVVRPHGDDGGGGRQAGAGGDLGQQGADHVAGLAQARQQPCGYADPLGEPGGPGARTHVVQLGRGGVRRLGPHLSGEPQADEVRDEEEARGGGEVGLRRELVDRVERQVLQARHGEQLLVADRAADPLDDGRGPVVAVAVGVPEQVARRVDQPVVDSPRVHPDARDRPGCRGGGQAGQDLLAQPTRVPVQRAVRGRDGAVGEAVHLDEVEAAGTDGTDHHPAAAGADVDRGDAQHRHRQRRNPAATPASTGTCRPVVWVRSPPVSANTALATCSGSTSRLRMVRWA